MAGTSGAAGSTGGAGADGSGGESGGTGAKGNDVEVRSSTKTALPGMTITDWRITASSLKGTISISDPNEMLKAVAETYSATITIYNEATGEAVRCYRTTDSSYNVITSTPDIPPSALENNGSLYFTTWNGTDSSSVLTPDTAYRLSVVAYYKMNETIYSREFISRSFYTDSTGVSLTADSSTTTSVTINATVPTALANHVNVYLLTPEQNKTFSVASIGTYTPTTVSNGGTNSLTFTTTSDNIALTHNTAYVARAYINDATNGLQMLTAQELEVSTLKEEPSVNGVAMNTYTKDGVRSYYNRTTGAYEIYRPSVVDPDHGVVRYIYTAYKKDSSGDWAVYGSPVERSADSQTAVDFALPSGATYKVAIQMQFDDNEKLVYYELGDTGELTPVGGVLPALSVIDESIAYDAYTANLTIGKLGDNASLVIDNQHPVTLSVTSNQAVSATLKLTTAGAAVLKPDGSTDDTTDGTTSEITTKGTYLYKATLNAWESNTDTRVIQLKFQNLLMNTQYAIDVWGYADLNDGNGPQERQLGTIGFRTKNKPPMTATWNTPQSYTTAFSRTLSLAVSDNSLTTEEKTHVEDQLETGQVTLTLYSGTGTAKTRLSQVDLTSTDQLGALYGTGLSVTENLFGNVSVSSSGTYTLEISEIVDDTYAISYNTGSGAVALSYTNEFDEIASQSEVITAQAAPPSLSTTPNVSNAGGIAATPIRNIDAERYGGVRDTKVPDDAIVGYLLKAGYDNSQRLAQSITYYAFEYSKFYGALSSNVDPVQNNNNNGQYTIGDPITLTDGVTTSNTMPSLALMFGYIPNTTDGTGSPANWSGSTAVRFMGDPVLSGADLTSGMGRGYRYIFAYTVNYTISSNTAVLTYPYSVGNEYSNVVTYGAGLENGVRVGGNVAYILNSGMQEAPCVEPEFHSYVYNTTDMTSNGATLNLHYAWRDPDITLDTTNADETKRTKLRYVQGNVAPTAKPLVANSADNGGVVVTGTPAAEGDYTWYTLPIAYTAGSGNVVVTLPDTGVYRIDYTSILTALNMDQDKDTLDLCILPVDTSFGYSVVYGDNSDAYNAVQLAQAINTGNNTMTFTLTDGGSYNGFAQEMGQRAYAVELTFTLSDSGTTKTFRLPIQRSGGSYYVSLSTGDLGESFVGKAYTVAAKVFYDTGAQGWHLLEDDGMAENGENLFSMQFLHANEVYSMGMYQSSGQYPQSALRKNATLTVANLRAAVSSSHTAQSADSPAAITYYSAYTSGGTDSNGYAYPTAGGVAFSGVASMSSLGDSYITPKGVACLEKEGQTGITLTRITPTVNPVYYAGSTIIYVYGSAGGDKNATINVKGWQQIPESNGNRYVYVKLYSTYEDAKNLTFSNIKGDELEFQLTGSGTTVNPVAGNFSFGNLTSGDTYYLVYYYKDNEGSHTLLKEGSSDPAVYTITTSGGVAISSSNGLIYRNSAAYDKSYFDKDLYLAYTVSRNTGISVRFQLLNGDGTPITDGNGDTLYTHDDLVAKGMLNGGAGVTTFSGNDANNVTIDMDPSSNRQYLIPGQTYIMRLTAYEGYDTSATEESQASKIQYSSDAYGNNNPKNYSVTLPPTSNYGAIAYVANATKDSITFDVSLNDVELSFMGQKNYESGAPLYAVRFTDNEGHWIHTSYDDRVFNGNMPKQSFTLDAEHISSTMTGFQFASGGTYWIHVYAVIDKTHNGLSEPTGADDTTGQDYKFFFGNDLTDPNQIGAQFGDFLDTFWSSEFNQETGNDHKDWRTGRSGAEPEDYGLYMSAYEANFLMYERSQKLTTDSGLYINENASAIRRYSGSDYLSLVLPESFGVVTKDTNNNDVQAFQRVDWSIKGYSYSSINGQTEQYSGYVSGTDVNFKVVKDDAGYSMYRFDIPQALESGYWQVTIQLRQSNDANTSAYFKKSFSYFG